MNKVEDFINATKLNDLLNKKRGADQYDKVE